MKTARIGGWLLGATALFGCGDDGGGVTSGSGGGTTSTGGAATSGATGSGGDDPGSASVAQSSAVTTTAATTSGDGGSGAGTTDGGGTPGSGGDGAGGDGGAGQGGDLGTGGAGTGGEGGACSGDLLLCSDGCVDTETNAAHCGACEAGCEIGEACVDSDCVLQCFGGSTLCEGECVDTDLDPQFCGDCETSCELGELCSAGECGSSCLGGTTQCGDVCVDIDLDPANCGGCDQPCDAGEVCSEGECGLECTGGTTLCAEACVDTDVDTAHCGGCDQPCDPGELCSLGECGVECAGDTVECDGGCVDTDSNPEHCGECDAPCGPNQACVSGDCTGTVCVPDTTELCYVGQAGTLGVGPCQAGIKTCNADGTAYGACEGQVVPAAADDCTNAIDDDCDGETNEGCVYNRCSEIDPSAPSGLYTLDTNGGTTDDAFVTYCDMETDGGGWALLYNSLGDADGGTTAFWQFPYVDRFDTAGTPSIAANFYAGRLYFLDAVTVRDEVEDLFGNVAEAFEATASSVNLNTMRFNDPVRTSGVQAIYDCHFAAGWSSSDFDGDTHSGQCSTTYSNVAQHYCACWNYNLGSDADAPLLDGGWGPHVATSVLSTMGLGGDATGYSRVSRITRWIR